MSRLHDSLAAIDAQEWEGGSQGNPFLRHDFLLALETSGSVGSRSGWTPRHLEAGGGFAPLYLKAHSQGEYVFDHAWAEAWQRAGGAYYPKLQVAVPFTPVPGPRLLGKPAPLLEALEDMTEGNGLSSAHITFCTQAEAEAAEARGWLLRTGQQFHWLNRGYRDFDDFLDALSSRKRKAIRRERAQAQALEIRALTGSEIGAVEISAMWAFYQDTGARKWGRPYLTRAFFDALLEMRGRLLLVLAYRDGRPVAGALNVIGPEALYGRYWGAVEAHPCLHFELCYYQAIDWAIRHRLSRVEAGAQGEHKLARGYLPTPTFSAHYIPHAGFRAAVARYLDAERRAVADEIEILTAYGPFRRGGEQEQE